jgi:hypothetical protein
VDIFNIGSNLPEELLCVCVCVCVCVGGGGNLIGRPVPQITHDPRTL